MRAINSIKFSFKLSVLSVTTILVTAAATVAFILFSIAQGLPKLISIDDYQPPGVTQLVTRSGDKETVIAEFFKERRYVVPVDKIPPLLLKAFIAAEDDTFMQHQGFDLVSIFRAGVTNFMAGQVVQGGSTITQQVAKSLFLSPERSFIRKFKELILAQRIEKNLNKQQILYLYLNQIYLGHGAYGVEAASRAYFRKHVDELSLAEMALLAGLPRAPSKFSPFTNPKRAKERQLYVLKRMQETGAVSKEKASAAGQETLKLYLTEERVLPEAAYLVEHLRRYLMQKYGEKTVLEDGLKVVVPSAPELYRASAQALRSGLREVDKRRGFRGPLRKLASPEEIETFLKKNFYDAFQSKFEHQYLTFDGNLSTEETIKRTNFGGELGLLSPAESYQALVVAPIDKKSVVKIKLFAQEHELSIEDSKWAKAQLAQSPLQPGDVVWVKLLRRERAYGVFTLEQEPQVQGALLSIDLETGNVIAMSGGYSFNQSEFNRAIQARRQPGSAYKPIIYSAAVEKGYTPASIVVDSPIVYDDGDRGKWKPLNFEEKFYGDTTFRQALINSRNIPTIKIVQSVGVQPLIEYSRRLGLTSQFNQDLSISLGTFSTSLLELVQVYALFPRLGRRLEPIFFSVVKDRSGAILEEGRKPENRMQLGVSVGATPTPVTMQTVSPTTDAGIQLNGMLSSDQVLDPRVAYVMTHLMKEVVEYGTGRRAKALTRAVAGKTGTTNDYKDAWFLGFTPNVVTGVWVGFDDQQSLGPGETGSSAAIPIWLDYMTEAVKRYPDSDFAIPEDIEFVTIDAKTGNLARPGQPNAIREAFIRGTAPKQKSVIAPDTEDSQGEFLKEDFE